jgi:putative ABC transport system ATP-binding protein
MEHPTLCGPFPGPEERLPSVQAVGVVKDYQIGSRTVRVLDGLSFEAYPGEYLSIVGPSGSGKTTLFNLIGGLDSPSAGKILVAGDDLAALSASAMAQLRCRRIGYVFQTFNLAAQLTALENVMLPMLFANRSRAEARRKAEETLERVGLAGRGDHLPGELSGGQQQRVAVARAFANDPAIVLADEPTGNLDFETGRKIIDLLREMNTERNVTIITATHDTNMLEVSDRILSIRDGRISRNGVAANPL